MDLTFFFIKFQLEIVELLVQNGSDLNAQTKNHETPYGRIKIILSHLNGINRNVLFQTFAKIPKWNRGSPHCGVNKKFELALETKRPDGLNRRRPTLERIRSAAILHATKAKYPKGRLKMKPYSSFIKTWGFINNSYSITTIQLIIIFFKLPGWKTYESSRLNGENQIRGSGPQIQNCWWRCA